MFLNEEEREQLRNALNQLKKTIIEDFKIDEIVKWLNKLLGGKK